MAYIDAGDAGFPGIWKVLGDRIQNITQKLIDTLMLRQALEDRDNRDVSEEELMNLIKDAMYAKGDRPTSMDLDEIVGEMEMMGLLIPTSADPAEYNQEYTVTVSEAILRERFGHHVKMDADTVGIADEGPSGKTTYDEDPVSGEWEDPEVFRENLRLFVHGVLNENK